MRKVIILTILLVVLVIGVWLLDLVYSIGDMIFRTTSYATGEPIESRIPHKYIVLSLTIAFFSIILGFIILIARSIRGRG